MLIPTYIFDSCRLFREGARLILNAASFDVLGMGETLKDVHTLPPSESATLFVIGNPASGTVLEFIECILACNRLARIAVVVDSYDDRASTAILERGAKGYLHKNLSAESFVKALQLIAEECSVVAGWPAANKDREASSQNLPLSIRPSPLPSGPILRTATLSEPEVVDRDEPAGSADDNVASLELHNARAGLRLRNLSPRETAILKLVMSGESNKQIARDLSITESTVKVHITTILRKIDVKNRTQAAIWALADPDFTPSSH